MPFQWREATKKFRWTLDDISQLPIATVETIGQGKWVMCCPLCGYGHDLRANLPGIGIYEPQCLAVDFAQRPGHARTNWRQLRAAWLKKYPDAARFKTVALRAIEAAPTGDTEGILGASTEAAEPEQKAA